MRKRTVTISGAVALVAVSVIGIAIAVPSPKPESKAATPKVAQAATTDTIEKSSSSKSTRAMTVTDIAATANAVEGGDVPMVEMLVEATITVTGDVPLSQSDLPAITFSSDGMHHEFERSMDPKSDVMPGSSAKATWKATIPATTAALNAVPSESVATSNATAISQTAQDELAKAAAPFRKRAAQASAELRGDNADEANATDTKKTKADADAATDQAVNAARREAPRITGGTRSSTTTTSTTNPTTSPTTTRRVADAPTQEQVDEATRTAENEVRRQVEESRKNDEWAEETAAAAPYVSSTEHIRVTSAADLDLWAGRIDAYLAGHELEGKGRLFAEAAFRHQLDPRLSPAISLIESGAGDICFRPHNAWGWGSSSWDSWEEAIEAHAAGLEEGYGPEFDLELCAKYSGSDGAYYFEVLQGELAKI